VTNQSINQSINQFTPAQAVTSFRLKGLTVL
jgi:hypothetical protein